MNIWQVLLYYCYNYDVGFFMVFCLFMLQLIVVYCQVYKGYSDLYSV